MAEERGNLEVAGVRVNFRGLKALPPEAANLLQAAAVRRRDAGVEIFAAIAAALRRDGERIVVILHCNAAVLVHGDSAVQIRARLARIDRLAVNGQLPRLDVDMIAIQVDAQLADGVEARAVLLELAVDLDAGVAQEVIDIAGLALYAVVLVAVRIREVRVAPNGARTADALIACPRGGAAARAVSAAIKQIVEFLARYFLEKLINVLQDTCNIL